VDEEPLGSDGGEYLDEGEEGEEGFAAGGARVAKRIRKRAGIKKAARAEAVAAAGSGHTFSAVREKVSEADRKGRGAQAFQSSLFGRALPNKCTHLMEASSFNQSSGVRCSLDAQGNVQPGGVRECAELCAKLLQMSEETCRHSTQEIRRQGRSGDGWHYPKLKALLIDHAFDVRNGVPRAHLQCMQVNSYPLVPQCK
jgi:hypothetical protein